MCGGCGLHVFIYMDLKTTVKDLVTKILNKKGLETRSVPVEEILLLETYDEHFQNYQLVKYIRKEIESELGSLVDDKLDIHQQHSEVAAIIDEILASDEYSELFYRLSNSTRTVIDDLLDGSMSQPSLRGDSVGRSSSVVYYNLDNSVGSDWSSLRESQGNMFISHLKIKEIAIKLSSSTEDHLEALTELQQCPLGDLPQCPEWYELKEGLITCLEDNDKQIVETCLKILKGIFGNYSVSTAREVHSIIVRNLSSLMKQHPIQQGLLDLDTDRITLYKFRFLHYIHLHVSSHWIRYNERLLEDIIREYFCLLEAGYSYGANSITCVHYLGLIDCLAVWFHKWMHGEYSRAKVLEYLMDNTKLIQYQILHTIEYPKTLSTKQHLNNDIIRNSSWVYSMGDLNYLLYVHNMRVLEKIICYERGHIVLSNSLSSLKGNIKSVSDLIVYLVETGFHCPSVQRSTNGVWSPVKLVADLLKCLASGNKKCRQLLYNDHFFNIIIKYLNKEKMVNREMLEEVVDALCMLVASVDGQKYLLKHKCTIVIVQYVITSLKTSTSSKLPRLLQVCLFYCRQLYSTADGLLSLLQYNLHNSIVYCLGNIKEKDCRKTLISNLLNFASTPKGVVILGQTTLLAECVQYMHERYQLKLQVSHCEKFGYGFMVTQVASTSCGMRCLLKGGYVCNLIEVLWATLQEEDVEEPLVVYTHPLDPSNRILHKAIVNVLNVISSYTSLYEAIMSSSRSSCNTNPKTINELLNLLLFTDSYHTVLNPMECHLCALRILSVLVTGLDSYILLEQMFGITAHLYRLQKEIQLPNGEYIIDPCSIERNRILVATTYIGGPNERVLPPHYLLEIDDEYNYPLFSNSPCPPVYGKPTAPITNQKKIDISSCTTLGHVQNLFIKVIQQSTQLSPHNVYVLLEKGLEFQTKERQPIKLKPRKSLTEFEVIGIELVLRYGKERGLLAESSSVDLSKLYLLTGGDIEKGFDWLFATLFLITASVFEKEAFGKTVQFIETFSSLSNSSYNWKYHTLNTKDLLCSVSIHHIELILQAELPLVHSAFKISGYSTTQACQDMINQCFWNYLDWPEICLYILLLILFGPDYQVYFSVSIISHLQSRILKACQDHNLLILLKEGMVTDFHISKHLDYLKFLEEKYRDLILADMYNKT